MKKCPFCAEEIQDEARVCKHCGRDLVGGASQVQLVQPKKGTSPLAWGCLIMIGLCGLGYFTSLFRTPTPSGSTGTGSPATPRPPSPEEVLARDVKIDGNWSKGGFGSVAVWNIKLQNTSKVTTWRDLQYETEYEAESGKTLHRNKGELNIVLKPGQTRWINEHNDSFIPQGAKRAGIRLIGGVYDTLPPARTPAPAPTKKAR